MSHMPQKQRVSDGMASNVLFLNAFNNCFDKSIAGLLSAGTSSNVPSLTTLLKRKCHIVLLLLFVLLCGIILAVTVNLPMVSHVGIMNGTAATLEPNVTLDENYTII